MATRISGVRTSLPHFNQLTVTIHHRILHQSVRVVVGSCKRSFITFANDILIDTLQGFLQLSVHFLDYLTSSTAPMLHLLHHQDTLSNLLLLQHSSPTTRPCRSADFAHIDIFTTLFPPRWSTLKSTPPTNGPDTTYNHSITHVYCLRCLPLSSIALLNFASTKLHIQ